MTFEYLRFSPKGGILLGDDVVCDGFVEGVPIRVQSHVHDDHMLGFDSSKGFQTILASPPTKALLIAERNADLPYRANLVALATGETRETPDGCTVALVPSGHMLGAVQVGVVLAPSEVRVAYSGDFSWPISDVVETDVLVVDSTYGSAESIRKYSPEYVSDAFIELVMTKVKEGPVHVKAHRGTLERALGLLDNVADVPVVASARFCATLSVYRQYGYSIGPVLEFESDAGRSAAAGRCIRLYGKGDGNIFGIETGTAVTLSAYMVPNEEPVLEYSSRAYRVALSGHADFEGTLEYIRATGASVVVTDNSRGGHAVELAQEVKSQLGLEAYPSSYTPSRAWGK